MAKEIITVSMDAEIVRKLRGLALKEKIRKGYMGKIINRATEKYLEEQEKNEVVEKARALLKKGLNLGGLKYKRRDELHDRKVSN